MIKRTLPLLKQAVASSSASAQASTSSLEALRPIAFERNATSRSRLSEHYTTTLTTDLLYSLYSHADHVQAASRVDPKDKLPAWNPDNPYSKNRPAPRPRANRYPIPNPSYTDPSSIVKLEKVVLSSMSNLALANKANLLPMLMAFEAITGEPIQRKAPGAYGPGSGQGLVVTRTTKKSASFKIRSGMPTGVKVELVGPPMYDFLETFVELVLPRLKTFNGVTLPPMSHSAKSPSSTSGVVSMGLSGDAMGLFPEIEANADQYPRFFGFNVQFVTSARGKGAQDQARLLLSGLGLPFVRR